MILLALAMIIGGFIAIIVGVTIFPTVADQVEAIRNPLNSSGQPVTGNVTGGASAILGLTNIFFALGILAAGVNMAVSGLKQAGLV